MMNLNEEGKGGTFQTGKATLALPAATYTGPATTVATVFCIDGFNYARAAATTNLPMTAAATQPVLTKCLYLICSDSAGTITSVKGVNVLIADLVAGTKVLPWPELPAGKCALGAIKIALANAATFTAGTTALNATDVTATYYDLFNVPSAPLTS